MGALLTGFVPGIPDAAARSIIARADGIPLYAVETVRMLVADGRLREREGGGFEPVGELGELSVPETLQALIAARLDGLDPADRALVQDAAVLGQSFTRRGSLPWQASPSEDLLSRLRALARADLIREETDPRSPERGQFAFVQALIREVAYGTLSLRDRRARHLAAARFFESLGEEELAGALAAHYLAAYRSSPAGPEADALAAQARVSLRAAADRATGLGASRQALAFLDQALEVAGDDEERAALLERAAETARFAAEYPRAEALATDLRAVRDRLGDRAGAARAVALLAETYFSSRQRERSRTLALEGLAGFEDLGDDPAVLRLLADLAASTAFIGLYDEAGATADRALALAERLNRPDLASRMLGVKGSIAFFQGRLWEGLALAEGAVRLAEEQDLVEEILRSKMGLMNLRALDDPRATAETERQVIDLARRLGRRETETVMLGNMAEDVRRTGDWDGMIGELDIAIGSDEDRGVDDLLMESARAIFEAWRGELTQAAAEDLIVRLDGLDDRDVAVASNDIRGTRRLVAGDPSGAALEWLDAADKSDLNAPYALPKAGFAAILAGDATTAGNVLDRLAALGTRGRAIEADIAAIRAGLAALEGDTAAAGAGYRAARTAFDDLGLAWDIALTAISAGTRLDARDAEIRGWLGEARATLVRLRTAPLVGFIDRLLEAPEAGPSPPADDQNGRADPAPVAGEAGGS